MAKLRRLTPLAALLAAAALHVAPAAASTTQQAVFQDDTAVKANPPKALATLASLGVSTVKVTVNWDSVAPGTRPRHFNPSDPAAPAYQFALYDAIVRAAAQNGLQVFLTVTGPAPRWATASGEPRGGPAGVWKPSASQFGAFVQAVGRRYSGSFEGLPAVRTWSLWNEPNYGPDLAPQGVGGTEVAAGLYRGLLGAGWSALQRTGHGRDTILIGETAPRAPSNVPGTFSGTKPLPFLRALYCMDSRYRALRGGAARAGGCPTTSAGTRAFRRQNPALFSASGFAGHLYSSQSNPTAPNVPTNSQGVPGVDPDYADLPGIGRLERTLDRLNGVYGSRTHFPIWNTEYGYRTRPPDPHAGVSPATAALYINWAEYISYRQPRLRSYDQYLLMDPPGGVFASGLETWRGAAKPGLDAYRLPLYLPSTTTRRGRSLEIWGAVRPFRWAQAITRTNEFVQVQYRRGTRGAWTTFKTLRVTNLEGYIDLRWTFPASGAVRLAWQAPSRKMYYSRTVGVTVR
jgi:hypothetical protein